MRLLERLWGQKPSRKSDKKKNGTSNYPYAVTRVRAMKSKLLPKETYPRLLNMGIDGITRFIQESEYKNDVNELAMKYSGGDLAEHALNRNLALTYDKLVRITGGELNYLVVAYLKRYDIWNIKTLLRGKIYNASAEDIMESLIAAGEFTYTSMSELAAKATYQEIIEALKYSEYYPLLHKFDGTNLAYIENELDKMYYTGLFGVIGKPRSKDRKLFLKVVRLEVDVKNLINLFRLKKAGVMQLDEIMPLMIEGGLELKPEKLATLPYDEFVNELQRTQYWDVISGVTSSDMTSLTTLESRLTRYYLESSTVLSHVSPISVAPILDYIIHKHNEATNLRIIFRGKETGLSDELIKDQLVVI
ncbi:MULTISPECIES: V-type ATP synthase subunit C [Methanosarcina]|uniref:A-type ATP synthase subunit C n=3 Tax=Methanosarcina barkeri TaxID=2208 RepID=A0A0E3QS09_METBA|nr:MULTISPECIES: V-type ATP synthase subunit C [Methanosarcina]AKB53590.1 V-type ATP synthase subunit C [Methanosarcina barkeri MS]AKB58303.1 V-type ATP synthase subunit C [Methanosarcina barkeri 227]AKJ39090.1 A1A0 archaeal ATP synthase subunit C AhaC [Methanosarcina barkeri CM1]OED12689.1 ATP synthase A1 subunit C [Methanosarcina sp. A14]